MQRKLIISFFVLLASNTYFIVDYIFLISDYRKVGYVVSNLDMERYGKIKTTEKWIDCEIEKLNVLKELDSLKIYYKVEKSK